MLMSTGPISAVGNGLCMSLMTIVMGDMINSFGETRNNKVVANAVSKGMRPSVTKAFIVIIVLQYLHFSAFTRICINKFTFNEKEKKKNKCYFGSLILENRISTALNKSILFS
ncbi:hypothetical protein RchiOBHm_Chr4g0410961 [Rosa chinensis]|uniref:Uncharacterized protein n=1 Tax=Rosa chinensis TaxID=74649 RepID=A0A2P6QVH0_ROSCH|nr:hypothetical protein RchiOBHm_Chr4g0410961 [Rosa chinensis]